MTTTRLRPRLKAVTPQCEGCAACVVGAAALAVLGQRVGWKGAATLRRQARPMLCTWGQRVMILERRPRPRRCGLLQRPRRPLAPAPGSTTAPTRAAIGPS